MSSTDRPRRPGLARRVALAGALSAALAGALAALVGGVTANRLVVAGENAEIRRVAEDFADEIHEEIAEAQDDDAPEERAHFARVHGPRTLQNLLVHEAEAIKLPGASAAVWRDGGLLAGDPSLTAPAVGACAGQSDAHGVRRVCAVPFDDGALVLGVGAPQDRARVGWFVGAIVLGAAVGALLGGGTSLLVARWAVAPLGSLRRRVDAVSLAHPSAEAFDRPEDYEEIEALRRAIAEMVARLADALSQAQTFASQAAHELRTPLSTIAGELELVAERGEHGAAIGRVRAQVDGLVALVQRLLALATPTGPGAGVAVDGHDVVDAVLDALPASERSRVRAEVEDDVLVRGDPQLLVAMLANGVGNALKFATGTVDVRAWARDGDACFDVIDDGPGVPAEERERVFAPFYRTSSARWGAVRGHGLGLALIAHVARRHDGEAAFLDTPRGAHLRVRLPRWRTGVE
jgi:signal transduction histidine kinase